MEKLQKKYDIDICWHSFQLRPAGSPPISPEHRARIEASRPRFQEMARTQYGLEVNQGPFGIDSYPALVAEKFAEAQGKGSEFHDAVQDAYWLHARSIDEMDVLKEIAEQVRLNMNGFDSMLDNPIYTNAVTADIEQAHEYGLNAVPAVVFNNKYLVSGAQPYEVFQQVTEKVQEE